MEALGLGKGQTSSKTYTMNNTRFSKKKKQKQKSSSHFLKNKIHFQKKNKKKNTIVQKPTWIGRSRLLRKTSQWESISKTCTYSVSLTLFNYTLSNFAAGNRALMSDHSAVTVLIAKSPGVLPFNNNLYRRTGKLHTQRSELSKKIVLDKSCLHRVV